MARLRLKVVACGVFEDELRALAEEAGSDVDVQLLDAGLHSAPDKLRLFAQEAVDEAAREGGYDAVAFSYGLCGRGTVGLIAREIPVVIPRVHDCISLFLGSARAYAEQFAEHPGTFYFTTGWYKNKAHPEHTRMAAARRFAPETNPNYSFFSERYGEENARYIVEFLESWRRNYTRAVLIDHGFATEEHDQTTREIAGAADWVYERIEGSLHLLRNLLAGQWDEEHFLVVRPGRITVATNDERILTAVDLPEDAGSGSLPAEGASRAANAAARVHTGTFIYGEATDDLPDEGFALGIDAGGTYTDAALLDLASGRLLGKAKAITTHHELVRGIEQALSGLDRGLLGRARYTCLSTTLATNAIVEGRGLPVGLLLMPYHAAMASRIKTPLYRCLSARMTIEGIPQAPVDESEVLQAAEELLAGGASAFAVSGYGSVRNPAHEVEVRELLQENFDQAVVCGHDLSEKLNFVSRAHTAVLNARLVPIVNDLLESVAQVLGGAGIHGPLFVVRGDGGIMQRDVARDRAIETLLSGPAASALGGRYLTGQTDALVVDMGGTTTDIAALRDGEVALHPEGARVGHWRTSVAAADIRTTGLGGDSAVHPGGNRAVTLGPERAVPLCMLGQDYPSARDELAELVERVITDDLSPEALDFFVLARRPQGLGLDEGEKRLVELLAEGPHSRGTLARRCGAMAPELLRTGRLERIGLVRRAGVTPTDALHVLRLYDAHDVDSARLGLRALGFRIGLDEEAAAAVIRAETERLLALAVMDRELADAGMDGSAGALDGLQPLLDRVLAESGNRPDGRDRPFAVRWEQKRSVVGIGAPVAAFLPPACRALNTEAFVPDDADVANAVGAATSRVTVREAARVRPGELGSYVVFTRTGREEFPRLEDAEKAARAHVVTLARERARGFGTQQQQVRVDVSRRVGLLSDGSSQLLEVQVCGTVTGAPDLG